MAKASSALEQLRALDEQRTAILESAKQEALARVNATLEELNALGLNYRLTQGGRRATTAASSRKGTRSVNPDRACPICGFKTNPPHDARAHRSQSPKGAFTAKELTERGLAKV